MVKLSDGTIARIRGEKITDRNATLGLRLRSLLDTGAAPIELACVLLAHVTALDGKPCSIEDIMDLAENDLEKLAAEFNNCYAEFHEMARLN